MRHYLSMWKHIFDYKGKSTREEYRKPLIVTAVLAALTAILWCVGSLTEADALMAAGFVTGALFTLHIPPMMSLTVRRLRDAGKKPWLAVLSCLAGVGTLIVMLICLLSVSATGYLPSHNIAVCVYGPPPEYYYPEDNTETALYGPPEMLLGDYEENTEETGELTATDAQEKESNENEQ